MAGYCRAALLAMTLVAVCSSVGSAAAQAVPLPTPRPGVDIVRPPAALHAPNAADTTASTRPVTPPASPPSAFAAGPGALFSGLTKGLASAGTNTAFDSKQRALLDRVSAYLSSVQVMSGDFVQVGPDGRRTEGDFYILKPGKVRFEYEPPSPIEIIADGTSVAVRDRKLATQDLYPLSRTPLRFLLADHIDLARDTNIVGVHADDVFVTVVIEEKQPLVGTHRLMMMFGAKDTQLRQWTVTDPQGYDTTVAVYNLDTTRKPPESLFKIDYQRMIQ
jgi:outer membrane lipoprotein-sorting protein